MSDFKTTPHGSRWLFALSAAAALVAGTVPALAQAADTAVDTTADTTANCPNWSADVKYRKGDLVLDDGKGYKAVAKSKGEDPSENNGPKGSGEPWRKTKDCDITQPPSGHWLVGYWHNFTNPSGPTFPIAQVSDDWDVIVVAFADNAGNGNVSFTLDPSAGSEAQFIADIKAKQAKGKKVVLSFGGQNGSVSLNNDTETTNFVNSTYALLVKYGFDGMDLDIETGVSQGAPIQSNLVKAVKQIKAKYGPSFYLSMAPEHPYVQGGLVVLGTIWGAYLPIIDGLRDDLNVIHVQYYNNNGFTYNNPPTYSMLSEGTVDALVGGSLMLIEGFTTDYNTGWKFNGLRPDQVAFGVPSGPSSANGGFVTSATVSSALNCLTKQTNCGSIKGKQAYPTFRGAMAWSINWDKHDGFNFSKPTRAALDTLP